MAGRTGDIGMVRALRANIVNFATTSADAKKAWTQDRTLDAWIIWGIWQKANPTLADAVTVEEGAVSLTRTRLRTLQFGL